MRRPANKLLMSLLPTLASVESVKARGIVDQHLFQKGSVVVGIAVKKFDLLGFIHHPLLTPAHMRPIRRPNSSVRSGFQIRAAKGYRIVPSTLKDGSTVAVGDHHPPVVALKHL